MTEAEFQIEHAVISQSIQHCMDEMGRFSDATTRSGRQRYYDAQKELREWEHELRQLMARYYGEE